MLRVGNVKRIARGAQKRYVRVVLKADAFIVDLFYVWAVRTHAMATTLLSFVINVSMEAGGTNLFQILACKCKLSTCS